MAVVSLVDFAQGTTTVAGMVVSKPAATVDGNLLVVVLMRGGTNATQLPTAPSGWTHRQTGTETIGQGSGVQVYQKIASSEPSTWTWTYANGGAGAWVVVAFQDFDTTRPLDVALHGYSSTQPITSPDVQGVTAEVFGHTSSDDANLMVVTVNNPHATPSLEPLTDFQNDLLALSPSGYWTLRDEGPTTFTDEVGSNDASASFQHLSTTQPPIFVGTGRSIRKGPRNVLNPIAGLRLSLPSVNWWPSTPNVWTIMANVSIQPGSSGNRRTIFGASGTSGKPQVEISGTNTIQAIIEGTFLFDTPTNSVADDTPAFIVVTRNGTGAGNGNYKCYVNGSSLTISSGSNANNTSGAFVGLIGLRATANSQPFDGLMSDVAIFPTALSSTDVSNLNTSLTTAEQDAYQKHIGWTLMAASTGATGTMEVPGTMTVLQNSSQIGLRTGVGYKPGPVLNRSRRRVIWVP